MPKHILLVEDEPDIAMVIGMIVRDAGYDLTVADTLAAARTSLAAGPAPDLVVLDLRLPDGNTRDANALTFCRELRALASAPPVVVLTASVSQAVRDDARAAGCTHFVSKPFDPDTLATVIRIATGDAPDRRRVQREDHSTPHPARLRAS